MIDSIYGFGNGLIGAPWWTGAGWPVVWTLIKIIVVVLPLMGAVAYLTLWERKAIGFTQIRVGPNRVGPLGLLQPIADALKLLTKEIILPTVANKGLYLLGPVMTIMPALAAWVVIPIGPDVALANINAGLLHDDVRQVQRTRHHQHHQDDLEQRPGDRPTHGRPPARGQQAVAEAVDLVDHAGTPSAAVLAAGVRVAGFPALPSAVSCSEGARRTMLSSW